MSNLIVGNMTLMSLLVTIIGLIILWIIVSIPVWLAGEAVTGGKATFGDAMIATLFGPIVCHIDYSGLFSGSANRLNSIHNRTNFSLHSLDISLTKQASEQGWLGGIAIAILAVIIFFVKQIFGSRLQSHSCPHHSSPHLGNHNKH